MRILIVINDYFNPSNGMSISTRRFVEQWKARGYEVRVVAAGVNGDPDYPLRVEKIPLFHRIIAQQGFHFAHVDRQVVRCAVQWADVVHVHDPFPLCHEAVLAARRLGKPVVGTFHLFPENMTASVSYLNNRAMNMALMRRFIDSVYRHCDLVIAPTQRVFERLRASGLKVDCHVVSNGIADDFLLPAPRVPLHWTQAGLSHRWQAIQQMSVVSAPTSALAEGFAPEDRCADEGVDIHDGAGKQGGMTRLDCENGSDGADRLDRAPSGDSPAFVVVSAGRLSHEKGQDTLIRAIARTREPERIGLVLAGKGPRAKAYKDLASRLGVCYHQGFYEKDSLRALFDQADLYVHCAQVEIEGMACMEAFARGLVPLIAEAPLSSTATYALSEANYFPGGDVDALAAGIDEWLDNPKRREQCGNDYVKLAHELSIERSGQTILSLMKRVCKDLSNYE